MHVCDVEARLRRGLGMNSEVATPITRLNPVKKWVSQVTGNEVFVWSAWFMLTEVPPWRWRCVQCGLMGWAQKAVKRDEEPRIALPTYDDVSSWCKCAHKVMVKTVKYGWSQSLAGLSKIHIKLFVASANITMMIYRWFSCKVCHKRTFMLLSMQWLWVINYNFWIHQT